MTKQFGTWRPFKEDHSATITIGELKKLLMHMLMTAKDTKSRSEHAQWNGSASSSAHERMPWRSPHVLSWAPEQVVWHAGELASTAIMDG